MFMKVLSEFWKHFEKFHEYYEENLLDFQLQFLKCIVPINCQDKHHVYIKFFVTSYIQNFITFYENRKNSFQKCMNFLKI